MICEGNTAVGLVRDKARIISTDITFEIIFASSDRDQAAFDEYYGEMPWLALPFSDRDRKAALSKRFKVSGIPMLVLLNPDG